MKYRVRDYFGKYTAYTSRLNRWNSIRVCSVLQKFFDYFATIKYLNDFTVSEVGTYVQTRFEAGTKIKTIKREVIILSSFWTYLIEELHLELWNPAKPYIADLDYDRKIPQKAKSLLTYDDIKRLLLAMDEEYRFYLIGIICGDKVKAPSHNRWARLQAAIKRAGLDGTSMKEIRSCINWQLRRAVIKDFLGMLSRDLSNQETSNTPMQEPQPVSDSLRTIESPSTNIGSSICNHSDEAFAIGWVNNPYNTI
jgi:integrase